MKRAVMLVLLACAPTPRADVDAAETPRQPLPSPTVPPAAVAAPPFPSAPALPDVDAPPAATRVRKARKKPAPPKIVLGEKHEQDQPGWSGVGIIATGKFTAKA